MNSNNKTRPVAPLAALTLAMAAFAGSASADQNKGFYVGGNIGQSHADVTASVPGMTVDKRDTSYGILGGYQFNQYFATELTVNYLGKARLGDSEAKTMSYSLDAIGSLPVNDKFSLFGRLGVAQNERDFKGVAQFDSQGNTGFKVGLGADYKLNKNWFVRTELTRYNNVPTAGMFSNTIDTWNVGVNYRF